MRHLFWSFHHLKRTATVLEDVVFVLGRNLQRKALRNGGLILIAYLSALIHVGLSGANGDFAHHLTWVSAVAALASYPLGTLLVRISDFRVHGQMNFAYVNHLNLMGDYKRDRCRHHLERLWDEVFCYEAAFRYTPRQAELAQQELARRTEALRGVLAGLPTGLRQLLRLDDAHGLEPMVERILSTYPQDPALEATRALFVLTGLYALNVPLPQVLQEKEVGFDISLLENWYRRSVFTFEDSVVRDSYANRHLRELPTLPDHPWLSRVLALATSNPSPSFWHTYTMRKYGAMLGRQIRLFNQRYLDLQREAPYFNAQHFLWPHVELEAHVRERFGSRGELVLSDLRATRRRLVRTIFSDRIESARRQIYLMFRKDVKRVLRLRVSYDPEFVAGGLAQSLAGEVAAWERQFGVRVMGERRVDRLQAQAQARLREADALLEGCCADRALTREQVRAVRMAYHVDYGGLRSRVAAAGAAIRHPFAVPGFPATFASADNAGDSIRDRVEGIAQAWERASTYLVQVRTIYLLAKLELDTYTELVESLAEYAPSAS